MGFNITKLDCSGNTNIQQGQFYAVKKGENLWSIARKLLGKKAKNAEIQDYTNKIAKLNNFETKKELNNLKINQQIYLPSDGKQKIDESSIVQNPPKQTTKLFKPFQFENSQYTPQIPKQKAQTKKPQKIIVSTPVQIDKTGKAESKQPIRKMPDKVVKIQSVQKTNSELGFEDLKNEILNTDKKDIHISCDYRGYEKNCYTLSIVKSDNDYETLSVPATFLTDKNHNLISIQFNGQINEKVGIFDFSVQKNGIISTQKDIFGNSKQAGKINPQEYKQIESIIREKAVTR